MSIQQMSLAMIIFQLRTLTANQTEWRSRDMRTKCKISLHLHVKPNRGFDQIFKKSICVGKVRSPLNHPNLSMNHIFYNGPTIMKLGYNYTIN